MSSPAAPPVVEVSHLSKRYCRNLRRSLRYAAADIGRELGIRGRGERPGPLRRDEFAALDDVSFTLERGESLAVVGANGAGKSTLLKVLYGLVKPDGGEVRLRGRVGALIELGTGFDPVLSGRENIAVNAAILGLSERELRVATGSIAEFAELEDSIDAPVRYYSSGMAARLAFAVAAHLEPDVLMVDEVLAVGDIAFQRKCMTHILGYLERGGALMFVSHNPYQVQAACQRGLLLEQGRCTFTGTAVETVTQYFASQHAHVAGAEDRAGTPEPTDADPVVIERLTAGAIDGAPAQTGEALHVTVAYHSLVSVEVNWGFSIWTGDHWVCVSGGYDTRSHRLTAGRGELHATVPRLPIVGGRYSVRAVLVDQATLLPVALRGYQDAPVPLVVESPPDLRSNAHVATQQLVTLDVDWD